MSGGGTLLARGEDPLGGSLQQLLITEKEKDTALCHEINDARYV